MSETWERIKKMPEHRHNWLAAAWSYGVIPTVPFGQHVQYPVGTTMSKSLTRVYCPDCKETQEVQL